MPQSPIRRAALFLLGIGLILALNFALVPLKNPLVSDSAAMFSVLCTGLIFTRLFTSFSCGNGVKVLLFLAFLFLTGGMFLSLTEEIDYLDAVPLLGRSSPWNSSAEVVANLLGVILLFCAIIVAVIELGEARNRLAAEMVVRAEAELALSKHRDQLEELVHKRTEALETAQAALLVRERLAALGEMMGTVSHELRNPLGTIRSSLFSLQKYVGPDLSEGNIEIFARCDRSILRCDHIIEELHDFSTAQEFSPQPTPLDPWLLALAQHTKLSPTHNMRLALDSNVVVPLDPERMERALAHLLENSVNAMDEEESSEKTITLRSFRSASTCTIQLQDTGAGMDAIQLARIKEPLFSTRDFGVGLGVPIALAVVRLHSGAIDFESELGKGTTVTITLPLVQT